MCHVTRFCLASENVLIWKRISLLRTGKELTQSTLCARDSYLYLELAECKHMPNIVVNSAKFAGCHMLRFEYHSRCTGFTWKNSGELEQFASFLVLVRFCGEDKNWNYNWFLIFDRRSFAEFSNERSGS